MMFDTKTCIFSRPLDDMEAWFQRFEAEEQRQRMIAQAMKEDSTKAAEGSIASESKQGNKKDVQQVVEAEVA